MELFGLILAMTICLPALGQTPDKNPSHTKATKATKTSKHSDAPPTARSNPNEPMLWNVDQMMEDAAMQITRRYNLNKAQENYTRLLLQERVREFLDEYEVDVRELLQESIDMRLNKRDNSPNSLKQWAIRAAPLYEAAKNAILDGNQEWRQILDEKQKKVHDQDISQMKSNFANVTRTLDVWMEGKGTLPVTRVANKQTGAQAAGGNRVSPQEGRRVVIAEIEDNWLAYVNKFIEAYHLDAKQAIAAREKIHKEQLARAKGYRVRRKAEFQAIQTKLNSKDRKIKPAQLMQRKRDLEQPIRTLFIAMDRRLKRLTTSQQRAGVDPQQKKILDTFYATLSGIRSTRRTTVKPQVPPKPLNIPTSQPSPDHAKKKSPESPVSAKDNTAKPKPGQSPAPPQKSGTSPKDHQADQSRKP